MPQQEEPTIEYSLDLDDSGGWSAPVTIKSGKNHLFRIRRVPGACEDGKTFSVKVVDETGRSVANVPFIFLYGGTSKKITSGSDGIAKEKAGADSVEVMFDSAESLSEVMTKHWKEATQPSDAEKKSQPNDGKLIAVSRPSKVETPEGQPFMSFPLKPGDPTTINIRPALRRVSFIEMIDTLFRTDSAVVLPEGEAPTGNTDDHQSLNTVGLIATVLRYNAEHQDPTKRLLIAGHCDTKGTIEYNQDLSEERAEAVCALLSGDRTAFIELCNGRHDEVDVTQIFDWTTKAFGFTCKPTTLTAKPSDERYRQFRESFNKWMDEWDSSVEPDVRGGQKLLPSGRLDKSIWGAVFDLYEYNLRDELGENGAGVSELRKKIAWVDSARRTLGFSEHFPVDEAGKGDHRSQTNRRVEVLFFDPGEEPDLDAGGGAPDQSDIYLPGHYSQEPLEPMPTAKRAKGVFGTDFVVNPEEGDISIDVPAAGDTTDASTNGNP